MRLWYISPAYLDNQRLLAAHQENHALLTCLKKGTTWGNVTKKHTSDVRYPQRVHDLTVTEMFIRKGLLNTPTLNRHPSDVLLEATDLLRKHYEDPRTAYDITNMSPQHSQEHFNPTLEDLRQDCQDLRQKWNNEESYFGHGRICLTILEKELGLPLGISLEEISELQKRTRDLVSRQYKDWFREYRNQNPKSRMQDRLQALRTLQSKGSPR